MSSYALATLAVLMLASVFNIVVGSLEAWWRTYAWRTADSRQATHWPEPTAPKDASRHFWWILCAKKEDEETLRPTLERLLATTHPHFRVVISLCTDDRATRKVVANVLSGAHKWRDRIEVVHTMYDGKSAKPHQLNFALRHITRKIKGGFESKLEHWVGVVDAESLVHPELLLRFEAKINESAADVVLGSVQLTNVGTRLSHWFQVHNVLEYFFWFTSRMPFQADKGFVPFPGNTLAIRHSLLVEVGGWPEDTKTEDCALGVLLTAIHRAKVVVGTSAEFATREQAPPTIFNKQRGSWFSQRERWNGGFLKELLRLLWAQLPTWRERGQALYILSTPLLQAFSTLLVPVALIAAIMLKAPVVLTMLMFIPFIPLSITMATQVIGLHEFGRTFEVRLRFWHYASVVLLMWPYQILLGCAAIGAVVDKIKGNDEWYKTGRDHGLSSEGAVA